MALRMGREDHVMLYHWPGSPARTLNVTEARLQRDSTCVIVLLWVTVVVVRLWWSCFPATERDRRGETCWFVVVVDISPFVTQISIHFSSPSSNRPLPSSFSSSPPLPPSPLPYDLRVVILLYPLTHSLHTHTHARSPFPRIPLTRHDVLAPLGRDDRDRGQSRLGCFRRAGQLERRQASHHWHRVRPSRGIHAERLDQVLKHLGLLSPGGTLSSSTRLLTSTVLPNVPSLYVAPLLYQRRRA